MKIAITKKFIIITPAPKRNKKNGLTLYLQRIFDPNATALPIVKTNLVKGQRKYSIPKDFVYTIKGIVC